MFETLLFLFIGDQVIKTAAHLMGLWAAEGYGRQKVPFYDQQQLGPHRGRAGFSACRFLFSTITEKKPHICIIYIVLYLNEMGFIFLYLELK